jgi:hypothetical protein
MDAILSGLIGAAWLGIAGLLAWNVFQALRRVRNQDGNLPFFGMLARRGISLTRAEQAVGIEEVSRAVRRCMLCSGNEACRKDFAGGQSRKSSEPVDCPNTATLERAGR